jgi:integrase
MARSRGNGEGSIYQRKSDGKWCTAVTLENGKRRVLYGKTRQEVAKRLSKALQDREQGLPVAVERQTVKLFLERWLEDSARPKLRPSTFKSYSDLVKLHLVPELGKIAVGKLTPQDVQGMMARKQAAGLSPRRVQMIRAVLRKALGQAVKWGLVGRNVATLVEPPRVQYPEIRPLTPEQARTLVEAAKGDRLEALYTVALAIGLRQGEALGLKWEALDLDAGTLHVRAALQFVAGTFQFVEPKTARSRRTIRLPRFAIEALRAHKVRQLEERLLAGSRWREHGLVFPSSIGTPLHAASVTHRFQALLARAQLPRQRFHDLRHCAATLMLVQGLSMRVVMETLGHSQISLTMNTYSHVMPALQQDAADRMDALFGT